MVLPDPIRPPADRPVPSDEPPAPSVDSSRASPGPPTPPGDPSRDSCVLCGTPMLGVHCKRICPNCGYREDCSDLF